jgi:hypothetical protein
MGAIVTSGGRKPAGQEDGTADDSRAFGIDDVRNALRELINVGSALEAARLLRCFGAKKASDVTADRRAAFVAAAQAEIEFLELLKKIGPEVQGFVSTRLH